MLQAGRCIAILILPALGFSQITANSITVTASQSATLQPDEAVFAAAVTSGLDKGLSDIVAALQGSGITAANFVGINSPQAASVLNGTPQPPAARPRIQWNFQLLAPIAKVKDTASALAALAATIPQNGSGLSLTFSVQGTQVSSPQNANCSLADLVASARAQAQQLSSAAGVVPGMIQAITTSAPGPCFLTVRFALGTVLAPSQPNSITVTATRPVALQPDEVSIALSVISDANAGLDDVAAALQQAGITGATFSSVYTLVISTGSPGPPAPQSRLQWSFTLTTPLSKIKDTFAALISAQQALGKASPAFGLSILGAGTQISPQLAQSQACPDSDLFKDAQSQAQQVAAAAGVSVGSVLSLGSAGTPTQIAVNRLGSFVAAPGFASFLVSPPPGVSTNCAMTVSFLLVQ